MTPAALRRPYERASPRAGDAFVVAAGGLALALLIVLRAVIGISTGVELKIAGVAVAVGFDVLALSIAIGIMHSAWRTRLRLAVAFSGSEVLMQVAGYALGAGVGRVVGGLAVYGGFFVLAVVGAFIVRESTEPERKVHLDAGWGLLASCAAISVDSLGIGVSLPGVPLPLGPLLATVAVSTVFFTAAGLRFGALLGRRYERLAQRAAGIVLIVLALTFTLQHVEGWAP